MIVEPTVEVVHSILGDWGDFEVGNGNSERGVANSMFDVRARQGIVDTLDQPVDHSSVVAKIQGGED